MLNHLQIHGATRIEVREIESANGTVWRTITIHTSDGKVDVTIFPEFGPADVRLERLAMPHDLTE